MNEADSSLPGLWTTRYVIHHFLVVATHRVLCDVTMCGNLQQEVFSLIYHPFDLWRLDSYLSHLGLAPSVVPGKANAFNKRWANVWMCGSHSGACYWKNRSLILRPLLHLAANPNINKDAARIFLNWKPVWLECKLSCCTTGAPLLGSSLQM